MRWAGSNSAEQRRLRRPAGDGSRSGIHHALVNTGFGFPSSLGLVCQELSLTESQGPAFLGLCSSFCFPGPLSLCGPCLRQCLPSLLLQELGRQGGWQVPLPKRPRKGSCEGALGPCVHKSAPEAEEGRLTSQGPSYLWSPLLHCAREGKALRETLANFLEITFKERAAA